MFFQGDDTHVAHRVAQRRVEVKVPRPLHSMFAVRRRGSFVNHERSGDRNNSTSGSPFECAPVLRAGNDLFSGSIGAALRPFPYSLFRCALHRRWAYLASGRYSCCGAKFRFVPPGAPSSLYAVNSLRETGLLGTGPFSLADDSCANFAFQGSGPGGGLRVILVRRGV